MPILNVNGEPIEGSVQASVTQSVSGEGNSRLIVGAAVIGPIVLPGKVVLDAPPPGSDWVLVGGNDTLPGGNGNDTLPGGGGGEIPGGAVMVRWADTKGPQEVRGKTDILTSFAGMSDVLRCVCQTATSSVSPTKANREARFPVVAEGRRLVLGFKVAVLSGLERRAFRTWADAESLTSDSNEGWRLADKELELCFNRKFSDGKNFRIEGSPELMLSPNETNIVWNEVMVDTRMHRTDGACLVLLNGQIVVDYTGPTMSDESAPARIQYGIASDSRAAGLTAWYAAPWYMVQ